MRDSIHNRFPRRDPRRMALAAGLLACLALPLAVAAVPALSWSNARRLARGLRGQVAAAPAPVQRSFDPVVRANVLDEVATTLRSLLPAEVPAIEIFAALRLAARANDVRLHLVQPGQQTIVAADFGDEAVARLRITLGGEAELARLAPFVRDVRAAGYPADVRSLTAARAERGSERYQFQLDLGFFQRVPPPADEGEPGSDSRGVLE